MDSSSKKSTNCCSSKALSSENITSHAVSSVDRSATMMVEIFRPSQKRDSRGVVAVLVSEVSTPYWVLRGGCVGVRSEF